MYISKLEIMYVWTFGRKCLRLVGNEVVAPKLEILDLPLPHRDM